MISAASALLLLVPATSNGGDDSAEWLELDREIASIAVAPTLADGDAPAISFDAILSYQASNDDFFMVGSESLSGVELRRVRGTWKGEVGEYRYKISGDLESGVMVLKDAYVDWDCAALLALRIGQYKSPLLWSGTVSSFADPFHDVQVTGSENNGRTPGLMLSSTIGDFDALLSIQNGFDGIADENRVVGRLQWNMLGENAFGKWHGAYGYGDQTQLSAAVGFFDDGAIDNGSGIAAEAGLVIGSFSARADAVQYDEEYDLGTVVDLDNTLGTSKADSTPSAVTLGYLFGEDEWEFLVRQESFDDASKTVRTSFGLVHYTEGFGPKLRWAILWQDLSSDSNVLEGNRLEVSLALAGS